MYLLENNTFSVAVARPLFKLEKTRYKAANSFNDEVRTMSKDDDIAELNDSWEDDSDDLVVAEPEVEKVKTVTNKDARRRLDELLEMSRIRRQMMEDF